MAPSTAQQAYRTGWFVDALRLVQASTSSFEDQVLKVEIRYELGYGGEAAQSASNLMRHALEPYLIARCKSVIAAHLWDQGRRAEALEASRVAAESAQQAGNLELIVRTLAQLLERVSGGEKFDAGLPLATQVRRNAIRSGDVHLGALVHLTFGRLEARIGRYDIAQRHFHVARKLVESERNPFVLAAADLGEAVVLGTTGDLIGSRDLSARGAKLAAESGWSKGVVAAAANLAFLCVVLGRLDEADEHLKTVSDQPFQSTGVATAICDTRAIAALLRGDYVAGEELIRQVEGRQASQGWYELKLEHTLIRLLSRQRRFVEAAQRAEKCLARITRSGLDDLEDFFRIARLSALSRSKANVRGTMVPFTDHPERLSILGPLYTTVAEVLANTQSARAQHWLGRAHRLSLSVGSAELESEIEHSSGVVKVAHMNPALALPAPDLDSAVTLLDLAGHPHVLGREALAVLEGADCTDAVALVATGSGKPRVIDGRNWNERELARIVEQRPEGIELLPVGRYRDELWQIVAKPKTDIDPYCTFAAIRKILAAAVALDQYRRDEKQRSALWPAEALDADPDTIWASEPMVETVAIARRIAPTPMSVLLTGETGTGKEMLARAIHRASDRADKPFLPFNCTAVPRDMLESQLFGYKKGAFTGADSSFMGVIRAAAGGTLFLDEIADVNLEVQPKLLRFLETREIHPLGESHPTTVDVRIIAATNASLEKLVAEGRFRDDLFYRLNVVRLQLPPLRERREEIPPLVYHYLRRFGDEQRKGRLTISDETLEYLLLFSWPGNVRQLANEIRRVVAMVEPDTTITPAMLSPDIQASRRTIPASAPDAEIRLPLDQPLPAAVQYVEQVMVRRALERAHGRVEEASRMLGISRKGLFLKRRRLGLRRAS
jgi:DNA-binding NtrC family response regulator